MSADIRAPEVAGQGAGFPEPDRAGSVLSVSKSGFHRVAYVEWGDPDSDRVVMCVHGLSRQGRDFDRVGAALASHGYRVVCPDLVGRGQSDWLKDPMEYNLPQYVMDMTVLLAALRVPEVEWIGTSLGGLIGMVMAGQAKSPIRRLVINDIGPFIPWQALQHLAMSVRTAPRHFPNMAAAVGHYRTRLAPFGHLSDDEWRHLACHSLIEEPDGSLGTLADPEITAAFRPGWFFNLSLWTYWDAITCPTLVLRGLESDLLIPDTALQMSRRGPRAEVVGIPECGHAPALLDEHQIDIVTHWMDAA